ncbi:hypothetical protein NECAME_10144 [Necator americanus]|uniref:Uncharacterized protein n=1 Tax=Necator americanus TaxID=51031 RepID=W2TCR5_NECAM|nr:hypothetical protein NECAME_10144 [Necator americanus]ETN78782.1 hypothetical protein NECAME_10144 [Necator americanus]
MREIRLLCTWKTFGTSGKKVTIFDKDYL